MAWITGAVVAGFGVLGLFLAAGAVDGPMSFFGYGLFGFAVAFDFWLVKLVADEKEKNASSAASAEGRERMNLAPVARNVDAAA
jgi:hypothetical protein